MGPVEPADARPRVLNVHTAADRKLGDRLSQGPFVVGLTYKRLGAGSLKDTPYRATRGTGRDDRPADRQVLEELVGNLQLGTQASRTGEHQCVTAGHV